MTQEEFSAKLKQLFTGMVQVAFEYVDRNVDEVDAVYVFCSSEIGYFFNCFFRINGTVCGMHQVNSLLAKPVDGSLDRMDAVLVAGLEDLQAMCALFTEFQGQAPTQMKLVYGPTSGRFTQDVSYETLLAGQTEVSDADLFRQWRDELKSSAG